MPWYNPITTDDKVVANWINRFKDEHGYSPTIREACLEFNWKSPSTGHAFFKRMERKGLIEISTVARREITVKV